MASPAPQPRGARSEEPLQLLRDDGTTTLQLLGDDAPPVSADARASDADITAVCALEGARRKPTPLGLPLGVAMRLRRAAARARDAVASRKASQRQVVAYLELLDENVLKTLYFILYAASAVTIALLIVEVALQHGLPSNFLVARTRAIPIFNVALASTLLALTLPPFLYLLWRINKMHRAGFVYSWRRRMTTQMRVAVVTLTVLLQVAYLVPNALELHTRCSLLKPFGAPLWFVLVEWWCWGGILTLFLVDVHWRLPWTQDNTTLVERLMLPPFRPGPPPRADAGFIDMGWHWRILTSKVIMYCVFEALFSATWALYNKQWQVNTTYNACRQRALGDAPHSCNNSRTIKNLTILVAIGLILFFVWFVVIAATAWVELSHRPYKGYRMANQTLRMTIGLNTWPMFVIILTMKILWLADWEECNSVILVWPGLAPAQVLMAAYAIVNSIIVLPFSRVDAKHVVQAAKQEFCWTRSEIPAALERRAAIAGGSGAAAQLDASEPMLVIETVLEALWFSMLAYEDAREVQPGVPEKDQTLPLMMQLCELDNMAAWHEHTTALHVIAAWSPMRIVVAFRGTAERANFWADMQLCLTSTTRLTDRGEAASKPQTRWGDRPAAHRGFMHTWTHARMNQRITSFLVARVNEALERTGRPPHVLLCGHSLGGALATLAAMDLREACGAALPPSALTVVTFGSPRVGSAALARHYDACVCPDHWSMVNQHDVITHGGRLCGVYKHVGKRVLINPRGDMIVRPDFVEASFQHWIGAESLDDHFLRRYRDAFRAVCCQYGATQERLDVLLQAMGAPPMVLRRGRLLPAGRAEEHAEAAEAAEEKARLFEQRAPRWMQGLLSRLRSPRVADERCPGAVVDESEV